MTSIDSTQQEPREGRQTIGNRMSRLKLCLIGVAMLLGTVVVAVNIMSLVKTNFARPKDNNLKMRFMTINDVQSFQQQSTASNLVTGIRMEEVLSYLNEFQRIATVHDGNRAIGTEGFNGTIDYLVNYLNANTNYRVNVTHFPVNTPRLMRTPIFQSSINGSIRNHTFSTNLATADFFYMEYSASTDFYGYQDVSVIPNVGCDEQDWQDANPTVANRVALIMRGQCTFLEKANLAKQFNARAILIYNDGTAPDRRSPIFISLGANNTIPGLFLSYELGQRLVNTAKTNPGDVRVSMDIRRIQDRSVTSANVCADTPTGDPTKTIVIGSHSDSVPAGPGINDNGSGSAANLALAVTLARLFRTPNYPKYKYRVRFCWWGAEEVGLLGSQDHVNKAKVATQVGERLQDYLINLNYDMLGSPNFIFGIYDGRTARNDTPSSALPGSNKISALFRDWFIGQNLPWDYTDFSGRSDYGPFLAEGIVAGGLFSGADETKKQSQRDRYDAILGQGLGGIPDVILDPCYHKECDTVQNINVLGYEKMVKAAAYALEFLGQLDDLQNWLYPDHEIKQISSRPGRKPRIFYEPTHEYIESTTI